MRKLLGEEGKISKKYLNVASREALNSSCHRSKCGSIIVRDDFGIIGKGHNSPPQNKCLEACFKDSLSENFKSDKTCCVHAEQRAIINALSQYGKNFFRDTTLYFIRLDEEKQIPAERPYCTICSKFALDNNIDNWVLSHKDGIYKYDSEEYNQISFGLKEWKL